MPDDSYVLHAPPCEYRVISGPTKKTRGKWYVVRGMTGEVMGEGDLYECIRLQYRLEAC